MQFLYREGEMMVFMDTDNYDQISIEESKIEDEALYLKDNQDVTVLFFNDKAISLDLPNFVILDVTQTDPGVKGDTASGGSKPATLETGLVVQVPLYLNEGETIKVDTRTGQFVERVKAK